MNKESLNYNELGRDIVSTGLNFFGKPKPAPAAPAPAPAPKPANDWKKFIPLIVGVVLAAAFVWGINSMRASRSN